MTNGAIEGPEYWSVIQVAKYLGVAPWHLSEQPDWYHAGLASLIAENKVQEKRQKQAERKRK